jgi:hypothetical protein
MNASYFHHLMQHPGSGSSEDIAAIQNLISQFPFSANLAITNARIMHEHQHPEFVNALEEAASKTISRKKLKLLIEGPLVLDWSWKAISKEEEIGAESFEEMVEESFPLEWVEEAQVADDEGLEEEKEFPKKPVSVLPVGKNPFAFSFVKVAKGKSETPKAREKSQAPFELKSDFRSQKPKKKEDALIEKFLETTPSISPPTIDFGNGKTLDLAAPSVVLDEEIITENMAMIYLKQKNFSKALSVYRKLQLKFPEKHDYFAALIKNLETTIL